MEKSRDAPGKRDGADGRWAWVVCICGTFSCMVVLGFCFSFGLLFPFLLNEFGQGKAKTAWVGSLAASANGLFAPITGTLCKRTGPRVVFICGALLCIAGLLLTTQAPSIFWMYLTYGGVFGLGSSAIFMSTFLEVPTHFRKRRCLAAGTVAMGPGGGVLVMGPIIQALLDVLDWRHTLIAMAAVASPCILLGFTYNRRLRREDFSNHTQSVEQLEKAHLGKRSTSNLSFWSLSFMRNPLYLCLTVAISIAFIGHTVPSIHLIRYTQDLGITADLASYFYVCSGLGSQLARLVTGRLCDASWFSPKAFLHAGLFASASSALLLPLVTSYVPLLFLTFVYGIADGLLSCGAMLSIMSCLVEGERPIGFGVYQLVSCLAAAGGPPLGGFIADISGSYASAFYAAGGFVLFAAVAMFITYCLKATEPAAVRSTRTSYELLLVTQKVSVL